MPEERTYTVFKFDELSDSAKEKAREWYREGALDHDWWDATYDDAARVADILGIDLLTKPVKLMGGGTRYDPCIYFSGFSSQGDGACFEGSYRYAKGAHKKIRKYAPKDAKLHRIADELLALQSICRYGITATMKQRGHYNHSGCMTVDVDALRTGFMCNWKRNTTGRWRTNRLTSRSAPMNTRLTNRVTARIKKHSPRVFDS